MTTKWSEKLKVIMRSGVWANDVAPNKWALWYIEAADVLLLIDRRGAAERDPEWVGFRNYLYGNDIRILFEHCDNNHASMLLDTSIHYRERLIREFALLGLYRQATISPELAQQMESHPELRDVVGQASRPELRHSVWGRVAVENGKPVGLYVDGKLVRQPVTKHWSEA